MTVLLTLGFALFAGLMFSRITHKLHLPDVTAYLIAGVLVGPYCIGRLGIEGIGFISLESVERFGLVGNAALGFIAFSIGNEFRLEEIKHIGKQAFTVGIVQAIVTTVLVDVALIGLHFILGDDVLPISYCITLGAIATATAPAATLMVVRQYDAKGKLTDLLLPVVALDDAVGLIVFAISFGAAECINSGNLSLFAILCDPLIEIVLSLMLGFVMGFLLSCFSYLFKPKKRTALVIAFVLLTVAISMLHYEVGPVQIGFSPLLACMMLGTVFCNKCSNAEETMPRVEVWTVPVNALFFIISGAELELGVFKDVHVLIIGVVYIVFRCIGKYVGSYYSCKATHCDPKVTKNLGITLWPQAGVALGMCVTVMNRFGEHGSVIRNIVLFAVLIYELFGPLLTKHALIRTGDITPENAKGIEH